MMEGEVEGAHTHSNWPQQYLYKVLRSGRVVAPLSEAIEVTLPLFQVAASSGPRSVQANGSWRIEDIWSVQSAGSGSFRRRGHEFQSSAPALYELDKEVVIAPSCLLEVLNTSLKLQELFSLTMATALREMSLLLLRPSSSLSRTVCSQCRRTFATTAVAQSGHNKWSKIKHQKGKKDAMKGAERTQLVQSLTLYSKSQLLSSTRFCFKQLDLTTSFCSVRARS